MGMTDYEYWNLMREGDSEAYRKIYDKYADQMYGFGMKLGCNSVIVENAIQTVFMNIFRLRSSITISSSIKAYLFTALKHQLIQDSKKESKRLDKHKFNEDVSEISDRYSFHIEIDHQSKIIESEDKESIIEIINNAMTQLRLGKEKLFI